MLAPTATDRLPTAAARLGHTVVADADDAPRWLSVVALHSRRTLCCLVHGTTTAATADANGHDAINDDGLSVRRGPLLRHDRIGGRHRVIAGRRRRGRRRGGGYKRHTGLHTSYRVLYRHTHTHIHSTHSHTRRKSGRLAIPETRTSRGHDGCRRRRRIYTGRRDVSNLRSY